MEINGTAWDYTIAYPYSDGSALVYTEDLDKHSGINFDSPVGHIATIDLRSLLRLFGENGWEHYYTTQSEGILYLTLYFKR